MVLEEDSPRFTRHLQGAIGRWRSGLAEKRGTDAVPSAKRPSAPTPAAEVKRVLTLQLEQAMNEKRITKAEMARRMETSRSQLNRLLDPNSDSVTLETLTKAARAVGRHVRVRAHRGRSVTIAPGTACYTIGTNPCSGSGFAWSPDELDEAIQGRVSEIVFDDPGTADVATLLAGVAETQFDQQEVARILAIPAEIEDWRVGEAIGEGYLVDHRDCTFPWPDGRDERKSGSSLPGADLVGFHTDGGGDRFAFGEIKTSGGEEISASGDVWPHRPEAAARRPAGRRGHP